MYVLGINGSPHSVGNTAFLIDEVFSHLKVEDVETERVNMQEVLNDLNTPFCVCCTSPCDGRCFKGTKLEGLYEKMKKADVILFGSPVFFGGPSAQIKCLFDKSATMRREKAFVGKIGAAIAVGASKYGGQEPTVMTLHNLMLVEGMTLIGDSSYSSPGHFGICAQKNACDDEYALARCKALAERILTYK